ncbi:MAG: site-2 protease family protein [Merismopedia sp. SIO2A8]|nr:site-2 protease family protein [Merismopedia sp. SIO2A8]
MKAGWRVGSIFGIPLFLDPSWFLILIFVTLLYRSMLGPYNVTNELEWGLGFAMALLLFASVLMHELGHSLVALSQGITVHSITLFLFGGIASIESESKTPGQAFQVAIAGPAVSLILCLGLTLVHHISVLGEPANFMIGRLAFINLVLAIFNMMPGLPLDGGQVLKAAIWKATGNRIQGVRWSARAGEVLGWGAIALGVALYVRTFELAFIWLAIIGWFGVQNAKTYRRVADIQDVLLYLQASDVMRREFRVVDATLSVTEFIQQYLSVSHADILFFAASNGRYRGQIDLDTVKTLDRSQWDDVSLAALAVPLTRIPSVRETTALPQVIYRLDEEQVGQITVLSPADTVAGVIDRSDILQQVAQALNLSIPSEIVQNVRETQEYPTSLQLSLLAKAVLSDVKEHHQVSG